MSKFKVGDKVKVKTENTRSDSAKELSSQIGTVISVSDGWVNLDIEFPSKKGIWDNELELIREWDE